MIITVASFKGGVGKTTTAIHLAAALHQDGPTLLLDGDDNRSALQWARSGALAFQAADISQAARLARDFTHIVIDTEARPTAEDFEQIARGCDLLVIPAVPGTLDTYALTLTIGALRKIPDARFKVLLTKVPPKPSTEGDQLRAELVNNGIPVFAADIPRLAAFEKAAAQGVVVSEVTDPRAARAWEAYQAAGREILTP